MRAPVAPIGWPERAGAAVDVDARVVDVEVVHGRHGDGRERLIDLVQIDIAAAASRAASRTLLIAPTGAVVNHSGSCAWLA